MPTPPPAPRPEREVPREVRYFTSGFVFRKLTFAERIKVLLGYNLAVEVHIATEHKPGTTKPMVNIYLSPHSDGKAAMNGLGREAEAQRAARLNPPSKPPVPPDAIPFPGEGK